MSRIAYAITFACIALAVLVDFNVDACAPTQTNSTAGRKKRSVEDDVHVVVVSNEEFQMAKNEDNMATVETKLREFADLEGISFRMLDKLPRTAENVRGKFGVHFTVEGAFEKCVKVLQFIQSATNEIKQVVNATVKCGQFEAVHLTKKGANKVDDNEKDVNKVEEA